MTVPVIAEVVPESTPPSAPVAPVGRRWTPATPLTYLLAIVVGLFTVAPVIYVVVGGFRTTGQLAADPLALPDPWEWRNYTGIMDTGSFWRQVFNSVLIAGMVTALVVLTGALVAFALARYDFRGRETIYNFFTLGLLFPAAVAILPLYLLMRNLDILDTPLAVALPEAAFGLPLTIVILRPFMRNIPSELEDAAMIDGCSRFGFFWRILMPLSGPALTTVGILAFVTSWNAYLLPLLLLSDVNQYTLPLGTAMFNSQYNSDTAKILAFTTLSMVPALTFFLIVQRRIIGGLTGAVKG
ncbi:MAG TPA: carbohydrate ABC transporter permease [Kineosporiaceae bacterium]|nr:carbohydrate ABC transporter permease [Kineosporiaceae bacterium]